jgi:UDP-glucose 4-epimerase
MRIFMTGATGFIGSYVLERLVARGDHRVLIMMRAKSDPWRIAHLLSRIDVVSGSTENLESVRDEALRFSPNILLHLAWNGLAGAARNDRIQVANLVSTLELVSLAHEVGAGSFIGLGSQAEYAASASALDEDAVTRPTSLYGSAKLCANLMAERLCAELRLRFAWIRVFAVYGPKDNPSWLIPSLAQQLLQGKRPRLTPGEQVWDYLFVRDAAEAICRVAENPSARGVFNLGSGQPRTIRAIAEELRDAIDARLPLGFGEVPYAEGQIMRMQAVIERLKVATGWSPSTTFDRGLAETVAWYRQLHSGGVERS